MKKIRVFVFTLISFGFSQTFLCMNKEVNSVAKAQSTAGNKMDCAQAQQKSNVAQSKVGAQVNSGSAASACAPQTQASPVAYKTIEAFYKSALVAEERAIMENFFSIAHIDSLYWQQLKVAIASQLKQRDLNTIIDITKESSQTVDQSIALKIQSLLLKKGFNISQLMIVIHHNPKYRIVTGHAFLAINQDWIKNLSDDEIAAILAHEIVHLLFNDGLTRTCFGVIIDGIEDKNSNYEAQLIYQKWKQYSEKRADTFAAFERPENAKMLWEIIGKNADFKCTDDLNHPRPAVRISYLKMFHDQIAIATAKKI